MGGGNTAEIREHALVRNLLKSCGLLTMLWSVMKQPQDLGVLLLTSLRAERRLSPYKTTE